MTDLYNHFLTVLVVGALVFPAVPGAAAQRSDAPRQEFEGVGVDRRLGETVPGDIRFRTTEGDVVQIGTYFDGSTPVILNLVYHSCPMLCGLMLDGFTSTLQSLDWSPGQEYRVLTVSFNHREGPELALTRKQAYVKRLSRAGAGEGWHFLTGSEASIRRLTEAVGFRFRWVPEKSEYAHPTTQVFLSGAGTVTRYIYGIELPRGDVRKALVEASNGTVGTALDRAAMYCFQFDPEKNTYTADAFNIMKIGSLFIALIMGGLLFVLWRREHEELQQHEKWEGQSSMAA